MSFKSQPPTTAGAGRHLGGGAPRTRRPTKPYGTRFERAGAGRPDAPASHGQAASHERPILAPLDGLFKSDARAPEARRSRAIEAVLPKQLFARPGGQGTRAPLARAPKADQADRADRADQEIGLELGAGTIVDKYRIESMLGVGGFAVVYLATHLLLQTKVALKMLRPRLLRKSPALAAALCQEARFAARIDHPNVVRVIDVTHGPELTYVVMEYVEGRTLAKAIRDRGTLGPRTVARIGLDVAAGLQVGLEQKLVHRDIKPANIILTPAGRAKIVDLGLASTIATAGASPGDGPTLVGTHGYMAPELVQEPANVDFRADVYALGVTLYQAAVGRLPFPADDPRRCMQMHCNDAVPAPRRVDPSVPEPLSEVLLWMLAKRRVDRPDSYEALRGALQLVLQSLPIPSKPDASDD